MDEKHQKGLCKNYKRLIHNIQFTFSWLKNVYGKKLKKFGITLNQFNLLRVLEDAHPDQVCVSQLQHLLPERNADTSRLVDRLFNAGLVGRQTCDSDRRKTNVWLTDQGLELLDSIEDEEKKWEEKFQNLSHEETAELNRLLSKLMK